MTPRYVERDGDWVLRPLGKLENVSMWVFALMAGQSELEALCKEYIDTPTASAVIATPLVQGVPFVLLVCANLPRAYSMDVDDQARGWMSERDVGFFVPVTVTEQGNSRTTCLIPYLFVDNFPAVLSGREIFGYPKVLAKIDHAGNAVPPLLSLPPPMYFTATSKVLPLGTSGGAVIDGVTIDVRSTIQLPFVPLPDIFSDPMLTIAKLILNAVGAPAALAQSFARIPMLFLKEFRSATDRTGACHQSVVSVEATIDDYYGGAALFDKIVVTLPQYESIHIATKLGLGSGSTFQPVAAVSLQIDFSLPFGTTLWTAP